MNDDDDENNSMSHFTLNKYKVRAQLNNNNNNNNKNHLLIIIKGKTQLTEANNKSEYKIV